MPVSVPRLNYVCVSPCGSERRRARCGGRHGYLVYVETTWAKPDFRSAPEAFRHGTIGTEVMPLPVALVLPDLFPHHFQPAGPDAGSWVDQFGFLDDPDNRTTCLSASRRPIIAR